MWKLYSENDGIAIKTTGKRLKKAFMSEDDIYVSKVNYIDYSTCFLPENNIFFLATHKRKSFEAEKEYRCIIYNSKKRGKKGSI